MKDLDGSNGLELDITNNLWSNPTAYFLKLNLLNALATGTGGGGGARFYSGSGGVIGSGGIGGGGDSGTPNGGTGV